MKKWVAIVDGFSGGFHLLPHYKKLGYQVAHIKSDAKIWDFVSPTFAFSSYDLNLIFEINSFDKLVAKLQEIKPEAVIPGTETGVEIADQLSEAISIKSNGTDKSSARRNKYEMLRACEEYGLPIPKFEKVATVLEGLQWYRSSGLKKVIVKPLDSAGTDGVSSVENEIDLALALDNLLAKENKLGAINNEILLCEFLEGSEYFINSVSNYQKVYFSDIWRYEKRSINQADAVYDRNILCESDGKIERSLQNYTTKVLSALDIKWGPAHTEIIMTKEGPKLVEIGARLDGLTLPKVNEKSIGHSAIDLIYEVYKDNKIDLPIRYIRKKSAQTVYLTSYKNGRLRNLTRSEKKLKSLGSFFQISMRKKEGDIIGPTTNYFDAPGFITLISEDPMQIENDYQRLREWEKKDELFEIDRT